MTGRCQCPGCCGLSLAALRYALEAFYLAGKRAEPMPPLPGKRPPLRLVKS